MIAPEDVGQSGHDGSPSASDSAESAQSEPVDQPPLGGPFSKRPYLTGDWKGTRQKVEDWGFVPQASYLAGIWGNVAGGAETGAAYEGFARWSFLLDLEKTIGWERAGFGMSWYRYSGGAPTELVGAFPSTSVSGNETSACVRFYEIYFEKTSRSGRLKLMVGQIVADEEFFVSEQSSLLENGTFGFLGFGRDIQVAPFYPLAAPGVFVHARSRNDRWEARFGAYTADLGPDTSDNIGFDWGFSEGAYLMSELRAPPMLGGGPGAIAIGFSAATSDVLTIAEGLTVRGLAGPYAMLDLPLIAPRGRRPGLGTFLRSYGSLVETATFVQFYWDAGLRIDQPLPGRTNDSLSLGVAQLRVSEEFQDHLSAFGERSPRVQTVLELSYLLTVTPWLTLQPDLQAFFEPSFSSWDALVLGLRSQVQF